MNYSVFTTATQEQGDELLVQEPSRQTGLFAGKDVLVNGKKTTDCWVFFR